jgi:hypothetical protein
VLPSVAWRRVASRAGRRQLFRAAEGAQRRNARCAQSGCVAGSHMALRTAVWRRAALRIMLDGCFAKRCVLPRNAAVSAI